MHPKKETFMCFVFVSLSLTASLAFAGCAYNQTPEGTSTASYMAVLLGLSGSKVMISMWIRPKKTEKQYFKKVSQSRS